MKLIRLFSLAIHRAGYVKSRSFVWFMMSLFVPGIICLYWVVALRENPILSRTINASSIVTYYVTTITLSTLLVTHMKEQIMRKDIQNGELTRYLLRPFSYYWYNVLFTEIPYRALQGAYSVGAFALLSILSPTLFSFSLSGPSFGISIISCVLGFFICSHIEMVLGLLSFWFYDLRMLHTAYEVLFIILGGFNMPLFLLPAFVSQIAFLTPIPSIVYIPALFITRHIPPGQELMYLGQQLIWFIVTTCLYLIVWNRGIRKFSAAGI